MVSHAAEARGDGVKQAVSLTFSPAENVSELPAFAFDFPQRRHNTLEQQQTLTLTFSPAENVSEPCRLMFAHSANATVRSINKYFL